MTRIIRDHQVNECNEAITISADEPDAKYGNASHCYVLSITRRFPDTEQGEPSSETWGIQFQRGPIKEVGVNGLTNEALLAVLIDRMRGFQSGPFSCQENAIVLTHLQDAQHWLLHRTRERMKRGVEGTNKV